MATQQELDEAAAAAADFFPLSGRWLFASGAGGVDSLARHAGERRISIGRHVSALFSWRHETWRPAGRAWGEGVGGESIVVPQRPPTGSVRRPADDQTETNFRPLPAAGRSTVGAVRGRAER